MEIAPGRARAIQSPLKKMRRRQAGSVRPECSACATSNSMKAGTVFQIVIWCELTISSQISGSGGLMRS
jgi:hypothetical protein